MANSIRYLVVDDAGADQDDVVDRAIWDFDVDNPPGWTGVGTTHRVETAPLVDGKPEYKNDHTMWMIVAGAWVEKSQAKRDAMILAASQAARCSVVCRLKQERAGAQAQADDTNLVQGLRDVGSARVTAIDAEVTAHSDNYENVWVEGTNP